MSKSDLNQFPQLLERSTEFKSSYECFLECQSKLMKTRTEVDELMVTANRSFGHVKVSRNEKHQRAQHEAEIAELRAELSETRKKMGALQLLAAHASRQTDSAVQMLASSAHERDCTPAALLFFSALKDESTLPSLQQIVLQLDHLRCVVDGVQHMDFPTLRNRIRACCDCSPSISNFISRYIALHKKWTHDRNKLLTERIGKAFQGDLSMICPLCSVDSRTVTTSILHMRQSDDIAVVGTDIPEINQARPQSRSGNRPQSPAGGNMFTKTGNTLTALTYTDSPSYVRNTQTLQRLDSPSAACVKSARTPLRSKTIGPASAPPELKVRPKTSSGDRQKR
eukprot:CAMPEP_0182424004 /NCGR_PEP_ID=MMETSP1167-20130531/10123_1 /TAXON_ID=2988 /ORGANISM="Mallomonas Sp, Strain CCMP3275" /LENGTH=338 /DNA_ID=CAMNT_0024603461 /DNA_START=497 /DNA_END=1513 /DNA_ORIENTATION=+